MTRSVDRPLAASLVILGLVAAAAGAPQQEECGADESGLLALRRTVKDASSYGSGRAAAEGSGEPFRACDELKSEPLLDDALPNALTNWEPNNCWHNPNASAAYDLAFVGAGIGTAYTSKKLRDGHSHRRTLALFEAGNDVGGRLVSAFQSGALGIAVRPFSNMTNVVPPEYGGMRVAARYPLLWEQIEATWHRYFENDHPGNCSADFCNQLINVRLCCPGLLAPMNVGNIRYFNTKKELGPGLLNSSLADRNSLYIKGGDAYSYNEVANYTHCSPYDRCLLLAVGVHQVVKVTGLKSNNSTQGFQTACSHPHCDAVKGLCDLCKEFPLPAAAVLSCTGYDLDTNTQTIDQILGLAGEVVNLFGETFLYLFTVGYQRFAQGLLEWTEPTSHRDYSNVGISPMFEKKVTAIGLGPGTFEEAVQRATRLARRRAAQYAGGNGTAEEPVDEVFEEDTEPVRLRFADKSVSSASMAYLGMLPLDAMKIQGMEPWAESLAEVSVPTTLFKAIIAWDEFSLARELDMVPCVQEAGGFAASGSCDRMILDGPSETNLVRQAWMWDYKTILIYDDGKQGSSADNLINIQKTEGTDALVERIVAQLQQAVQELNITIPRPAWFRSKYWPMGSIENFRPGTNADLYSDLFRRPFGTGAKVWYGNSEMARDRSHHGWAEGALDMAERSLPELKETIRALPRRTR